MQIGDLIRVRHHSVEKDGKIGIVMETLQHVGMETRYVVKLPTLGYSIALSSIVTGKPLSNHLFA